MTHPSTPTLTLTIISTENDSQCYWDWTQEPHLNPQEEKELENYIFSPNWTLMGELEFWAKKGYQTHILTN